MQRTAERTLRVDKPTSAVLLSKIEERSVVVGVIGLGYVGLPLSLAFVKKGIRTLGFDIDSSKVEQLSRGQCYLDHLDARDVAAGVSSGLFEVTVDFSRLGEPDAILICVPTPLTPQRCPDLRFVETAARRIGDCLRVGQLVVLESTTYPGTTDELVHSLLEESGLRCGTDFFLAFSPEREDPGRKDFTTATIPKLVGGVDPVSGEIAEALYACAIARTVRMSSARAAEAAKLAENVFRAVNIALVNELKVVYERLGVDIWEVLDAAETKPFGFMRFDPGPGWGGHCIPLDPFYLSWKAREVGLAAKFVELAGEVNTAMPRYVVEKVHQVLNDRGVPLKGSRILILGVAYKADISDDRESPAYEIMELLRSFGADISYHDPHVPTIPRTRRHPHLAGIVSQPLTPESLARYDAVIITTAHRNIDYGLVLHCAPVIVDTRGVFRGPYANVIKA